jgi:hypothetical protein
MRGLDIFGSSGNEERQQPPEARRRRHKMKYCTILPLASAVFCAKHLGRRHEY